MTLRFRHAMLIATVASFALVSLPACNSGKKKKSTEGDSPTTQTTQRSPSSVPGPSPTWGSGDGIADPPRGPMISTAFEAGFRPVAVNNMKQIVEAMHAFADQHQGALPGGFADKTGKPGLSWRVALLPYLEQDNLFKQFKLDEPWNSPDNKKLIDIMPKIYAPPNQKTFGYTFCRGFTGEGTWLPPRKQPAKPGEELFGLRLNQFTDGMSNTIVIAEATNAVIWTKPDELLFTPGTPPKLGGGVFASGFAVGMADGSSRYLRSTVNPKSLANAIQVNDGMVVDLDN